MIKGFAGKLLPCGLPVLKIEMDDVKLIIVATSKSEVPEIYDLRALEESVHDILKGVITIVATGWDIDSHLGESETSWDSVVLIQT